jgi:hypothetical protein
VQRRSEKEKQRGQIPGASHISREKSANRCGELSTLNGCRE